MLKKLNTGYGVLCFDLKDLTIKNSENIFNE